MGPKASGIGAVSTKSRPESSLAVLTPKPKRHTPWRFFLALLYYHRATIFSTIVV